MARRTGILAAIAALVSGCSATGHALNALVPASTYEGREGVSYGRRAAPACWMCTSPCPAKPAAPPIVVFFYGGNWESGEAGGLPFCG
jgi:acetyl esterase/lipase